MLCGGICVFDNDHLTSCRCNVLDNLLQAFAARAERRDISDVAADDALRILPHNLTVNLRVLLAAVANQNEALISVSRHNLADAGQLVAGMTEWNAFERHAPVSQQRWPHGNLL